MHKILFNNNKVSKTPKLPKMANELASFILKERLYLEDLILEEGYNPDAEIIDNANPRSQDEFFTAK